MLSWLFKKRGPAAAPAVAAVPAAAARPGTPAPPRAAAQGKASRAAAASADDSAWAARLQAAQGDDAALLHIAQSAPSLGLKIAAVQALTTEAVLKQAEREFRDHDRKVHRLAKQRLEAAVAQREARAQAQRLLQRTEALLGQDQVPVNHLVALDREWAALPLPALEPEQCRQFSDWRAHIDRTLQAHQALQQRQQRWCADVQASLPEWQRALAHAAEHGQALEARALALRLQPLCDSPDASARSGLGPVLAQWQHDAAAVEQHLAWWQAQPSPPTDAPTTDAAAASPEAAQALGPWAALPAPTDGELRRLLQQRFDQAARARQSLAEAVAAPQRKPRPPPDAWPAALLAVLDGVLPQAEAALADGQLGALQQHLAALDDVLHRGHGALLPAQWRARHQAVQAEYARLRGWQRWGGSRARDDLVAQAEALAQHTAQASDAHAKAAPRLQLKAHAQAIHAMRQQWKELDRLGAAASPESGRRFDAALLAAHQPVAAQHAALDAARHDNLAAREALLSALDALQLPEPAAPPQGEAVAWRELLRERERLLQAWRKLGPIEHTVPKPACAPLQQRLRSAMERIDTPWQQAQQAATVAREALIARAQALSAGSGQRSAPHDATRALRELQAEWQDQARRCPLPRALETALWDRFKQATDAVFAQRDAAFAARDAELAAQRAAREALLQALEPAHDGASTADIERTLTQVDRAWRQADGLPRALAESLESRYRAARAAAAQRLSDRLRSAWVAQCDGLAARLQLCQQREDTPTAAVDLAAPWDALAPLPARWQQALAQRWARGTEAGPLPENEVDVLLLQLESALALPTAPQWQAARQQLKLRALKQALEGRGAARQGSAAQGSAAPAAWLLAMLQQSRLSDAQRERLQAVVAALRSGPPGALGSATGAA